MATKNSTYVQDRIKAILKTNSNGTKQFGVRDQAKALTKYVGAESARLWLGEHIRVTKLFRGLLQRDDWAAADTETTSPGPEAEIIEKAIVRHDGSIAYESLFKPTKHITEGSIAVHGITPKKVELAPTFKQERDKIQSALDEFNLILFYNKDFDLRLLDQTAFEHGVAELEFPEVIDPMPDSAVWVGDWNSLRNGFRWPKLEGGHRAAGDCTQLIEVIKSMSTSNIEYISDLMEELKSK